MNQKINEIIKKEEYAPYDIFLGIIYYIPKEKSLGKRVPIHNLLYELKQKYASKNNLLDCFGFCINGICPVSGELEDAFYSLMLSHLLCVNEKDEFIKNKDANKSIEDYVLPLFNKKERKQLQMMAGDYVKILSEYIK